MKAWDDFRLWAYLRITGWGEPAASTLVQVARLETGHYTSRGWTLANNPFGMAEVKKRPTTQVGAIPSADGIGIGQYSSLWDAVRDYSMWAKYWDIPKDSLSPKYFRLQNPSQGYPAKVDAVSSDLRVAKTSVMIFAPLTWLAVRAVINQFR